MVKIDPQKSYRCPKFDGDAKQTLEIRVERKRNVEVGELGEVNFIIYKLGVLGEVSFGMLTWVSYVRCALEYTSWVS